jgi:PAS domain-containing protein
MLGEDEQLRRFQALVHASPDFIAIAGIDGHVEFLNAAGRELVGMAPDVDVTQTSLSDYVVAGDSFTLERAAVVRDGYWTGETTLRDWRDDSAIPVMVTSVVLLDQQTGAPVGVATIQRDLREMRAASARATAATAALEQGHALQQALFLHLSDLVLLVDADLDLVYASPSARRLLGYAEGTRVGKPLLDLVHPEDAGPSPAALSRARPARTGPQRGR